MKMYVLLLIPFVLLSCNRGGRKEEFQLYSFSGVVSYVHVDGFKTGGINVERVYLTNGEVIVVNGYFKGGCPLFNYLNVNDSVVRTKECRDVYVFRNGEVDTFCKKFPERVK